MRQTDLSFEETMDLFNNPLKSPYRLCMLVNEIGDMAQSGDTRAFQALINFLSSDDPRFRFIAACWLGNLGDGQAIVPLRELVKKEEERIAAGKGKDIIISAVKESLTKLFAE